MFGLSRRAKASLLCLPKELRRKVILVLGMGIHESIVLKNILSNGSTTVRDLQPQMNCPYSAIRDVQRTFDIPLDFIKELRSKNVVRNGKERQIAVPYKRYFISLPESISA